LISIKLEVWLTVNNSTEAKDIADDIHNILNKNGITNNINVTDEYSE